jgi:hypothetical protein
MRPRGTERAESTATVNDDVLNIAEDSIWALGRAAAPRTFQMQPAVNGCRLGQVLGRCLLERLAWLGFVDRRLSGCVAPRVSRRRR